MRDLGNPFTSRRTRTMEERKKRDSQALEEPRCIAGGQMKLRAFTLTRPPANKTPVQR